VQPTRPHEEIRVDGAEALAESVSRAGVEGDAVSFERAKNIERDVLGGEPFQ
jgi:hypothetical protein